MTTRRLAIILGLSLCAPTFAQAQIPAKKPATLQYRKLTSADSGFTCSSYWEQFNALQSAKGYRSMAVTPPRTTPPTSGWTPIAALPAATSFEQALFAPELVMQRGDALGLTADQRKTITDVLKTLQTDAIDLQWKVQAEQAKLIALLEQRPIGESAATAQMTKLLEVEAAMKQKHFQSLLRIKNALTDAQVQQLNVLQRCGR